MAMPYTIRAALPADAADWLTLRELLWPGDDHATEISRYFLGALAEPVEVLLAIDDDDTVVAHVELSVRDDVAGVEGLKTGYIEGLYIDAKHRAGSLAIQLLRASERWAHERGCQAFASDRDDRVIVHANFAQRARSGISS